VRAVTQRVEETHGYRDKLDRMIDVLEEFGDGKALVFSRTKRNADEIEEDLRSRGIRAVAIHGDKSQGQRESALRKFKEGSCRVMVGTDVASRGLDIPSVEVVIQFDLAENIDDYVHRIGRTGRCGNQGTAVAFIGRNEKILRDLLELMRDNDQEIPDWFRRKAGSSSGSSRRGGSRYGGRDRRKERW